MSIAAWNVRTLLDWKTNNTRPERRTAIVAMELQRYGIDIVALSETRFAGEGQLTENNCTFYWKGKNENELRMHGVGFAVSNALVNQLTELPVGISERLMTLRVKLVNSRQATMISAYAPTLDATDEDKEMFYAQLDTILTAIPESEKIFLLGDFNARVGRSADVWTGVIGRHGVGNVNDNGILLLIKCAEHRLLITNTTFRLKDKQHHGCILDRSIGTYSTMSSSDNGTKRTSSQPEKWLALQPAPPTTD